MSDPLEEESEKRWDELFACSPDVLERLAEEALREHREGNALPLDESACSSMETLETFLGDSLNRPPASPQEMAELRELAKADPAMAAVLSLYDRGGLDVQAILDVRNAE